VVFNAEKLETADLVSVGRDAAAERIMVFGEAYDAAQTKGYLDAITAKQGVFTASKTTPVAITEA